jgi:hypothetical protein
VRGTSTVYNNRNVGANLQSVTRDGAKVDLQNVANQELSEQRKYKLEMLAEIEQLRSKFKM